MSKKILLVDDHALIRAGLSTLIKRYTPHTIVAEVADGLEAIEQARQHRPDLIIMDIGMPGLNGLETVSQIRQFFPKVKILILSVYRNKRYVISAIRKGAQGYLLKDGALEELIGAIERIMAGKRYISPELHDIVVDELMGPRRRKIRSELEDISARERQVLSMIAGGASRGEIAEKLHISPETVKTHRKNIMVKLHLHKQSDLVKFALHHHLGPLPESSKPEDTSVSE